MIDDDRLDLAPLLLHSGGLCRGARQQVLRLFAHHQLPLGGGEDGEQADFQLRTAHGIPGNPDAIRSTELTGAEVVAQLLLGEDKLAIGFARISPRDRVVESIYHELSFDRNRLVFVVVEIDPAAKAARRGRARRAVHRWRPKSDDARWRLKDFLLFFGIRVPEFVPTLTHRPAFRERGAGGPTANQQTGDGNQRQIAKRVVHVSVPDKGDAGFVRVQGEWRTSVGLA